MVLRAKLGALACAALTLAACDPGGDDAAGPAGPAPAAATTTAAPKAPADLPNLFLNLETGANGNAGRATLRLGHPVPPAKAPAVPGGSMAAPGCLAHVDAEHDLVIPFAMGLNNANTSLSLPPNFAAGYTFVFTGDQLPSGEGVSQVSFFSSGARCVEVTPETVNDKLFISIRVTQNLAPAANISVGGYILLTGVVQPNFPDGDPALLGRAFLTPQQAQGGPAITFESSSWKAISPPIGQITKGAALAGLQ